MARVRFQVFTAKRSWETPTEAAALDAARKAANGGQVWSRLETRGDGPWVVYAGGIDPEGLDDDWEEIEAQ